MSTTSDRPPPPVTDVAPDPAPPVAPAPTWATLRPLVLRLHFYAGMFVAPSWPWPA